MAEKKDNHGYGEAMRYNDLEGLNEQLGEMCARLIAPNEQAGLEECRKVVQDAHERGCIHFCGELLGPPDEGPEKCDKSLVAKYTSEVLISLLDYLFSFVDKDTGKIIDRDAEEYEHLYWFYMSILRDPVYKPGMGQAIDYLGTAERYLTSVINGAYPHYVPMYEIYIGDIVKCISRLKR